MALPRKTSRLRNLRPRTADYRGHLVTGPAILEEDTLELELTPDEVVALSRAAAMQQGPDRSDAVAAKTPALSPVFHNALAEVAVGKLAGHKSAKLVIGGVATTIAIIVLGSAAYRAMSPRVLQPRRAGDRPASAQQSEPEHPQLRGPNVRFTNPFDPSEVFEFPARTSEAEAKELLANVLLQRARDRRHK